MNSRERDRLDDMLGTERPRLVTDAHVHLADAATVVPQRHGLALRVQCAAFGGQAFHDAFVDPAGAVLRVVELVDE